VLSYSTGGRFDSGGVVIFDRYRVLSRVGDSPYTVALVRDPKGVAPGI
jgi:hypothetical protein